jgi:hypothetical protein
MKREQRSERREGEGGEVPALGATVLVHKHLLSPCVYGISISLPPTMQCTIALGTVASSWLRTICR